MDISLQMEQRWLTQIPAATLMHRQRQEEIIRTFFLNCSLNWIAIPSQSSVFNSGNYPFRSFNHFIQLAAHIICTLLTIQNFYRALFLAHTSYSSYSLPSLYSLRVSVFCICANMAISAKSPPPPLYSVSDADGLCIVWAGDHIVIFKYLLPAHNKQPYITPADILILPGIITLPSFFSHYCTF